MMVLLDPFSAPGVVATMALSLIAVVAVSLIASSFLERLERIQPSDVPAWVWTLLIFFTIWATQTLITPLLRP